MLHCNSICPSGGLVINFKNLTRYGMKSYLRIQIVVRTSIFMTRKRKTAVGLEAFRSFYEYLNRRHPNLFCLFYNFFGAGFLLRAHQELVIQHYGSSDLTDQEQIQVLSFEFLDFAKLLIHNISPFQQLFCQAMEFRVEEKDQLQLMLLYAKCPLREGADLVSLNESCFFNSAFCACAPKVFFPIFCNRRTTRFDAFSLFFLFDTITFHFYLEKYFFMNFPFF